MKTLSFPKIIAFAIALCLTPAMLQAQTGPISLTALLNNASKSINYNNNLDFNSAGLTVDWVQGNDGEFRRSDLVYSAVAYKITLPEGSNIRIHSSKPDGDSYLYVYKAETGGEYSLVAENDDCSGSCEGYLGLDSYLELMGLAAGDYYIVVTDWEPERAGDYSLRVWSVVPVTITELLDKTTRSISYNDNLFFIAGGETADWVQGNNDEFRRSGFVYSAVAYKITMPDEAKIKIHSSKPDGDSFLYVYKAEADGEYSLVAENDDCDGSCEGYLGLDSYLELTNLAAGDYYIVVTDWAPEIAGEFLLQVWNAAPITITELLDNATKSINYSDSLAFVSVGETVNLVQGNYEEPAFRWSGSAYSAVAYKIILPAGANIKIHSSKPDEYNDSYLYVYKAETGGGYSLVAENDDCSGSCEGYLDLDSYLELEDLAAGEYYIVVTDYSPYMAGNYSLKVWNTEEEPITSTIKTFVASKLRLLNGRGSFQIQGLTKPETVRLFSMNGSVLMNRTVDPNESVSISHLPKGMYLVNVNDKTFRLAR